jgi:hypothetical protein
MWPTFAATRTRSGHSHSGSLLTLIARTRRQRRVLAAAHSVDEFAHGE